MATATYLMCKKNIDNIENNIKYIRSVAPHANPNKLLIKLFEQNLGTNEQIAKSLEKKEMFIFSPLGKSFYN